MAAKAFLQARRHSQPSAAPTDSKLIKKGRIVISGPFCFQLWSSDQTIALTAILACSSAWYEERTSGPDATFLKPIL